MYTSQIVAAQHLRDQDERDSAGKPDMVGYEIDGDLNIIFFYEDGTELFLPYHKTN